MRLLLAASTSAPASIHSAVCDPTHAVVAPAVAQQGGGPTSTAPWRTKPWPRRCAWAGGVRPHAAARASCVHQPAPGPGLTLPDPTRCAPHHAPPPQEDHRPLRLHLLSCTNRWTYIRGLRGVCAAREAPVVTCHSLPRRVPADLDRPPPAALPMSRLLWPGRLRPACARPSSRHAKGHATQGGRRPHQSRRGEAPCTRQPWPPRQEARCGAVHLAVWACNGL